MSLVLHDLSQDVEEAHDIARAHPRLVKQMHTLLKRYVRDGRRNVRQ